MSIGEADFGLEISKGILSRFVMAIIGFAGSIVFARVLGPSGYGAFYVVVTLVNILDNPVTGWGTACKKRLSETGFSAPEALGSGLLGALIVPLVMLPGVVLFQRHTNLYDLDGLLIPFLFLFVVICGFTVSNQILSARANFSASEWTDTLRSFFTTPLQIALVFLGYGAVGMVYGLAIATLLTIPYVFYRIGVRPVWPSLESLTSIASYAKYSVPSGFIGTAQSRIDILLLGGLLTSTAVGKYQVAMQLTMAGTFIGSVTSSGLMARVSEHWSRDDRAAMITDVTNSLGYASVLAIPILFGTAAMPNDLVVIVFGPDYAGIGAVLVGLALYRVLSMQSAQLRSTLAGLNRPDIEMKVGVVVLIINVGLGYLLLLRYGIIGVVAATVVSEAVTLAFISYIVRQDLPELPLVTRPLCDQVLAGALMFVLVKILHIEVGVSWWGDLALLVGAGGVAYGAALTAISKPFRATIRGVLSDALGL